ncbi:hypothetical protein CMV_022994 [Castanea mollissima]|uniref:60S ribosomal protein L27 n=1 Tax=Castanea mollissima TaxID=60419 RepID=A0A8J4VB31_9ROSI|nr:hypothetical protein CMV_022994 [Castanea mollissima]
MPTRYTLDVDLKDVVAVDSLQSKDKKVTAAKETKKRLEERFKTGKNRWFFTKLRDVIEAKDLEYKAWAHVQTLKSSLDEHSLELRVKTANEAEAISQQIGKGNCGSLY